MLNMENSKKELNEVALQNAIVGKGYILYDPESPLIINSETKILKIYNKDLESELGLDDESDELEKDLSDIEDEGKKENDEVETVLFDFICDDEDEEFVLNEMINRTFNHYDNSLEEEKTSFDEYKYREVRIVFADRTSNPEASNKVKYSKVIFNKQ